MANPQVLDFLECVPEVSNEKFLRDGRRIPADEHFFAAAFDQDDETTPVLPGGVLLHFRSPFDYCFVFEQFRLAVVPNLYNIGGQQRNREEDRLDKATASQRCAFWSQGALAILVKRSSAVCGN